jgi:hypothetical protein
VEHRKVDGDERGAGETWLRLDIDAEQQTMTAVLVPLFQRHKDNVVSRALAAPCDTVERIDVNQR